MAHTNPKNAETGHALIKLIGQAGDTFAMIDATANLYRADHFPDSSLYPQLLEKHATELAMMVQHVAESARAIVKQQMEQLYKARVIAPPVVHATTTPQAEATATPAAPAASANGNVAPRKPKAAKKQPAAPAPPRAPATDPLFETEDEVAPAKPDAPAAKQDAPVLTQEPMVAAAAPTPTPWNGHKVIAACATEPAEVTALPVLSPAAATAKFQRDPKVKAANAPVDIGNGIMVPIPQADRPAPGTIVMLGPHHFAVPIPGVGGKTHYLHTTGMGLSSRNLRVYTAMLNTLLGKDPKNFYVNPFGPNGNHVGSAIVRNIPMCILLSQPDEATQQLLLKAKITYTVLPFDLQSAAAFHAGLERIDEYNMENTMQVVAFLNMLVAVALHFKPVF